LSKVLKTVILSVMAKVNTFDNLKFELTINFNFNPGTLPKNSKKIIYK